MLTERPPRVALLTNVLSRYRVPCFRELSRALEGSVRFFVLTRTMEHRRYVLADAQPGLPVTFLSGWTWRRPPHDDVHLNDIRPLCRNRPEVVILASWSEPTFWLVWTWAKLHGVPILLWIESTERDRSRGRLKERLKHILLRHVSGCIVPGQRTRAYCQKLGMDQERVFVAPNATDREYFRRKAGELVPRREHLRRKMGLEGLSVLFAGRFVEDFKGIESLIRACSVLESRGHRLSLVLVGDGPDRHRYERIVAAERLRCVRFTGILEWEALCECYAAADILALPSLSEPWGFVLNEAMEFGLPLVISDAVGAGPDLVADRENGFIVPAGDVRALTSALDLVAMDPHLRRRMSEASSRIIEEFTPGRWAKGVVRAVDATLGGRV